MGGLLILIVGLVALLVLDLLAQRYGVDSRPEFDDPRASARGLFA
jgi:hypothetical protein